MTASEFLSSRLAPFRVKEYRRLYFAQSMSWIGTWMQDMGKSWIVLSQFGRGKEMAALMIASALPVAMFSIFAGILADRQNPRNILLSTQISLFSSAVILAALAYTGVLEFRHLIFLGVIEGLALAFNAPAFQVILPKLVGKEHLQQTLALNSSAFHLSRILGPALGGIILALWGAPSIFLFNAIGFLILCFTIYKFKNLEQPLPPTSLTKGAFKEFIDFLWENPLFVRILIQFILVLTFVFPHTFTTLRILVTDRFNLDAAGFGIMLTGPGLGAFLGSSLLVILKPEKPYKLFPYGLSGLLIFSVAILFCQKFWLMNILLTLYSFSMFLYLSSLLVSLQIMTDNSLRGRLSALIALSFGAWAPAMSALWSWMSDFYTTTRVLSVTTSVFAILSLMFILLYDRRAKSVST